jgi:hypothetical protein
MPAPEISQAVQTIVDHSHSDPWDIPRAYETLVTCRRCSYAISLVVICRGRLLRAEIPAGCFTESLESVPVTEEDGKTSCM